MFVHSRAHYCATFMGAAELETSDRFGNQNQSLSNLLLLRSRNEKFQTNVLILRKPEHKVKVVLERRLRQGRNSDLALPPRPMAVWKTFSTKNQPLSKVEQISYHFESGAKASKNVLKETFQARSELAYHFESGAKSFKLCCFNTS